MRWQRRAWHAVSSARLRAGATMNWRTPGSVLHLGIDHAATAQQHVFRHARSSSMVEQAPRGLGTVSMLIACR